MPQDEPEVGTQKTANPFLARVELKPVDFLVLFTLGFALILAADALSS